MAAAPAPTPSRHEPSRPTDPAAVRRGRRVQRADRGTHVALAATALLAFVLIVAIASFVIDAGWPSFRHNGLSWVTDSRTPVDRQIDYSFQGDPVTHGRYRHLQAWPLILGTLLTTGGALLLAVPFAIFAAVFIAELAPRRLAALLEPVVELLAATPSVVFGLFAFVAVAPLIQRHLIDPDVAADYAPIVALTGANVLLGAIVLAIMVAPLMIAIFANALRAAPLGWREGARALGCSPWRMERRVVLPAIRPALIAGSSLAAGRAIGEAIALSMATGQLGFTPNPADGWTFFLEPVRTLASGIVDYSEGFSSPDTRADLFAFGAVLFVSTAFLTVAARVLTIPLSRRSGVGA